MLFTPPADIAERPVQVRRLYEVGLVVKLLWGELRIPATDKASLSVWRSPLFGSQLERLVGGSVKLKHVSVIL